MKTDLVVAGYLIHDFKVLLIHHKKLGIWIPPGGHIDENETPDNALRRQLKEELNLEIEFLNRTGIIVTNNHKVMEINPYLNIYIVNLLKDREIL